MFREFVEFKNASRRKDIDMQNCFSSLHRAAVQNNQGNRKTEILTAPS